MIAIAAAILAGLFYALTSLFSRVGLERAQPGSAAIVSSWVNALVFWPIFLVVLPLGLLRSMAVIPFIAAGMAGPFLGRLTLYYAIRRLGVSLSEPLFNAQVVFIALGGVIFFDERITPLGGLGIAILMLGLGLISTNMEAGNIGVVKKKRYLLIPLVSAFFFGISTLVRKVGLSIEPEVFLGLPVAATSSLFSLYLSAPLTRQAISIPRGRVLIPLVLAGCCSATAQFMSLTSINRGDLVVVIPLQNMSPIFTVAITALLLRRLERVTRGVVVGVVFVAGGAALVNF